MHIIHIVLLYLSISGVRNFCELRELTPEENIALLVSSNILSPISKAQKSLWVKEVKLYEDDTKMERINALCESGLSSYKDKIERQCVKNSLMETECVDTIKITEKEFSKISDCEEMLIKIIYKNANKIQNEMKMSKLISESASENDKDLYTIASCVRLPGLTLKLFGHGSKKSLSEKYRQFYFPDYPIKKRFKIYFSIVKHAYEYWKDYQSPCSMSPDNIFLEDEVLVIKCLSTASMPSSSLPTTFSAAFIIASLESSTIDPDLDLSKVALKKSASLEKNLNILDKEIELYTGIEECALSRAIPNRKENYDHLFSNFRQFLQTSIKEMDAQSRISGDLSYMWLLYHFSKNLDQDHKRYTENKKRIRKHHGSTKKDELLKMDMDFE
jgi:hypothetical protein